ncbi:macro domain-like protein [Neoconidiobolus thromboides FSU 785]|nr:macro domain-like protein [Neoconidiobolus thromboides FSU 785]
MRVSFLLKAVKVPPDFYINSKVSIWKGDITKLNVDVIVNATTFKILHGYGVTKAIVDAGGPEFVAECKLIGGCGVGDVCITKGYRLPAKHVIHTVGPAYQINDKLKSCYVKSLELASSLDPPVSSIAFPCISTGINRFPNLSAANIALNSVSSWLRTHPETSIKRVIFCTYLKTDQEIYYDRISTYFPVTLPKFGTFAFH